MNTQLQICSFALRDTICNYGGWENFYMAMTAHTYQFTLLQVDANAFFVDYGKVAVNLNYIQAVSDLRVAATYVIK